MTLLRRLLITLACYALSGYGLLFSLYIAFQATMKPGHGALGLALLLAWSCHLVLCLHWCLDRRSGRALIVTGCLSGAVSLAAWPLALRGEPASVWQWAQGSAMALGATLPCVVLAVWIVRASWRRANRATPLFPPAAEALEADRRPPA
jgi:hypothetical protein